MINSYKCDRCGSVYSNSTNKSNKYMVLRSDRIDNDHIDLCPDCYKQLKKWLENIDGVESDKPNEQHHSCHNCKYTNYPVSIEPCFSCYHSLFLKSWEPKEV